MIYCMAHSGGIQRYQIVTDDLIERRKKNHFWRWHNESFIQNTQIPIHGFWICQICGKKKRRIVANLMWWSIDRKICIHCAQLHTNTGLLCGVEHHRMWKIKKKEMREEKNFIGSHMCVYVSKCDIEGLSVTWINDCALSDFFHWSKFVE